MQKVIFTILNVMKEEFTFNNISDELGIYLVNKNDKENMEKIKKQLSISGRKNIIKGFHEYDDVDWFFFIKDGKTHKTIIIVLVLEIEMENNIISIPFHNITRFLIKSIVDWDFDIEKNISSINSIVGKVKEVLLDMEVFLKIE